ncbi:BaiN/RdsA family NAD(P)/FAD-dependent oxidoreductase [Arenibaculum pallidiluteum]|uniref:NAD(P)/FAD-dependent oxidoreductase n=1 Tax=Arenibaculum pallidiluteum TaxID=2812559 RepID=UPI002E2DFAC3|nr:NAD(P)/FAD-dependent oxidoreductase [Arenibaculum pallidiluteum]
MSPENFDVIVIGAGAAGLMCAAEAGRRGRRTLVLDHADEPGRKILISGGGRCNFTNLHAVPDRFVSANRHFAISALRRYTQHDFVELVRRHRIAFHEKKLGQLFCDGSAREIVALLMRECADAKVSFRLSTRVESIGRGDRFELHSTAGRLLAESVVVATGGLSVPKLGATGFGHEVARRFGMPLVPTRPGLVPFTFAPEDPRNFRDLTGVACDVRIRCGDTSFDEALLFTHRGISGPAVLQISSYWSEGQNVEIDFAPSIDLAARLRDAAAERPKAEVKTLLGDMLPRRLAQRLLDPALAARPAGQAGARTWDAIARDVKGWAVMPAGTEGYRTAEVTVGGVDTDALSSRTMEAKAVPGLYFVGEAVDVTGWLGGYNFQWAWSSGWAAGQAA